MTQYIDISPVAWMSFILAGMTVLVHVTLVNMVLGLSILVPMLEYISYRRGDPMLLEVARRSFRFLAVSDLVAGVWGTWLTIVLAGLWPSLTYIAMTELFTAISIALVGILVSIPSIVIYWYSWDRVSPRTHIMIGVLMGASALAVPAGFRAIFAYIDNPDAMPTGAWGFIKHPLYIPLLIHTWLGALTMASLLTASIYAIKSWRSRDAYEAGIYLKGYRFYITAGLPILVIQSLTGIWLYIALGEHSPYLFKAINGFQGVYMSFLPLFIAFLATITAIWVGSISLYIASRKGGRSYLAAYTLALSSALGVPLGEALHDAPRIPYMVLTEDGGIHVNTLANSLIPLTWDLAYIAVGISASIMAIFFALLYTIYIKKI
ncbi:MAG: cytochrome ubiquinol oxidase subunit I [Sulfolobales archaeon]